MNIIFSSESQNGFYFSYQSDVTSYNVMAGTTSKRLRRKSYFFHAVRFWSMSGVRNWSATRERRREVVSLVVVGTESFSSQRPADNRLALTRVDQRGKSSRFSMTFNFEKSRQFLVFFQPWC